jgi:acetylornithine deacetylase/succinyl-diaminopimelate desuccinylase-like protein
VALDFAPYDNYIDAHFDEFVVELREFCAQPALAGQGIGIAESVEMVRGKLDEIGATVEVVAVPDGGAPVILGEMGSGVRTLLMYNHYDVQPPEPLELWNSPPYAGEVRDGRFYARGVADDKGDLLGRIQAIRAYEATCGPLPLKIRWLIEGEEEVTSPHLAEVVRANRERLQADFCAWENGSRNEMGMHTLICGQKGLLNVELRARGADRDIHSRDGGIVPNAAWRLVQALATIKDAEDRITLDGLDEMVVPPSKADLDAAARMPFEEETLKRLYGVDKWQRGLTGRDVLNARMFEPTCNIAGFVSGYGGPGSKTIVPSEALVKMDFRLVPNQTPDRMMELLRAHLDRRGFSDVKLRMLGGRLPGKTPVDHPFVREALAVWEELEPGSAVAQPMTGGSGPLALIANEMGIPAAKICGPGYEGSAIHSPNEHVRLEDYKLSLRYWGRLLVRLADN